MRTTTGRAASRGVACFRAAACALLLAAVPPVAQSKAPLLWPLPVHEGCTSSFGEFRSTHLHMGVDMRTHQEEGWPVFAAGNGRISRLRREPEGYGRVLYLDLDDGRTVVYGHLCRYSRALGLEQRLQEACAAENSSFPGDVYLSPPVSVKRGDVVAYSGQLGIGAPHLHFEVRQGDDACDPFGEGLELPGGMEAPVISGVAFLPRDASGEVDGGFTPVCVAAVAAGRGRYRLSRAVTVSGAVDVMLSARDHLGIPDNSTGLSNVSASLDGAKFFSMNLGCISFAKYKESPLLFDTQWTVGDLPSYRLRRPAGFGIAGVEGDGLPSAVAVGPHALAIAVSNQSGLKAVLEGEARFARPRGVSRLALPGGGYALRQARMLPAGIWLTLSRRSEQGVTPVLLGGKPVGDLLCEVRGGDVEVLLPGEALQGRAGAMRIGAVELPGQWGAGPATLKLGGWTLEVPPGAFARLEPEAGGGSPVNVACGPFSMRGGALLSYKAPARFGEGIFFGGRWAKRLDGRPINLRGDGVYAIGEDRAAPKWGGLYFATFAHLGEREARLTITDSGSGPDPYSLHVLLDGRPVYPDWHSALRQVRVDLTGVAPGRHVLSGRCSDKAGNSAVLAPVAFVLESKR